MFSSIELETVLSHPIALLGLGATGRSVLHWLVHRKVAPDQIAIIEDQWTPEKKQELKALGIVKLIELQPYTPEALQQHLEHVQTVIVSPGIFPNHPVKVWAQANHRRMVNDIQLWAWALQPDSAQIIGITGSNGKSTVTAWTEYIANACGKQAVAAGNIGLPVLEVLKTIEQHERAAVDVWILELSSFQLEDCEPLAYTAATVLNISEDHLDYHGSIKAYQQAKERILLKARTIILPYNYQPYALLTHQIPIDFGLNKKATWHLKDQTLWERSKKMVSQSKLHLLGDHNALNALVVLALIKSIGYDPASEKVIKALCDFKGLAHRVEKIAEYKGIDFIEDSKGTNVGSTVAALEGLGSRYKRLLLIAGGDGKGQDFSPLRSPIAHFCSEVFLIGRDALLIAQHVQGSSIPFKIYPTLETAVAAAFEKARSGDAVVLSPACASWDMFRNYVHRAEVFYQTVHHCIERAQNVSTH